MDLRCWLAATLISVSLGGAPGAVAQVDGLDGLGGTVFLDANANGARDIGEAGVAGIVVTNGRELVVTGADGAYALPEGPDGLVYLTRPDGFGCEAWYRHGSGDFALVPTARGEASGGDPGFFFIHMSDGHVFDRPDEVLAFVGLERPWWVPRSVFGWFAMRKLVNNLPAGDSATAARSLRAALAPFFDGDVDALWDSEVLPAYMEALLLPGSPLGDGEGMVREAFAEIAELRPEFVVNTGDIVLDSNEVRPETVERWMQLYREVSERGGHPVYNTIGNHGLGSIYREGADPEAADYGPGFFRQHFGPSYYSFDRGGFHFVALDTHHPPQAPDAEDWRINRMRSEVATWLENDLAQHRDRVGVALNHEPFRGDPSWGYPAAAVDRNLVPDEPLVRHGVAYALTGHSHLNGLGEQRGIMNINTGALSGLFWLLPEDLFPRGYRLLYAREGHLYSAWKDLGQPLLALAEPAAPEGTLVIAAAGRSGPLRSVRLELDGQPLTYDRWGDYFLHVGVSAADASRLVAIGTTADGDTLQLSGVAHR